MAADRTQVEAAVPRVGTTIRRAPPRPEPAAELGGPDDTLDRATSRITFMAVNSGSKSKRLAWMGMPSTTLRRKTL